MSAKGQICDQNILKHSLHELRAAEQDMQLRVLWAKINESSLSAIQMPVMNIIKVQGLLPLSGSLHVQGHPLIEINLNTVCCNIRRFNLLDN